VIRATRDELSKIKTIDVPHVGLCKLELLEKPWFRDGTWAFSVDVLFPDDRTSIMLGIASMGSGIGEEAARLPLPEPDFEDPVDKEFPPEHQRAWFALLEELDSHLGALGLSRFGAAPDYLLVDDYYPSTGVSGTLLRPKWVTKSLADSCQQVLSRHSGYDFWIAFDLAFDRPEYRGSKERLVIREDRIVLDLNLERLRSEFPDELRWE
jgi:hypothetical protein